jgi:hypothetical protein
VSDSLVTVASYWFPADALLAKSALEAAGIDAVVDSEQIMRGVKLRVRNVDALRAGDVLESSCEALEEIGEADEEPDDSNACPACGSADIVRNSRALGFAVIAALVIGIGIAFNLSDAAFFAILAAGVLLLISDRQRCAECGETWN